MLIKEIIKTTAVCQPGKAAVLYRINGDIIKKPGTAKEIIL